MLNNLINELTLLDKNKNLKGGFYDNKNYIIFNKNINKKETSFLYDILKKYNIKYQEDINENENYIAITFDYRKLQLQKFYNCLIANNYKNVSIKNTYILIDNNTLNYDDLKKLFLQFTEDNPGRKLQLKQYFEKNTKQVLYYKIVKL